MIYRRDSEKLERCCISSVAAIAAFLLIRLASNLACKFVVDPFLAMCWAHIILAAELTMNHAANCDPRYGLNISRMVSLTAFLFIGLASSLAL